MPLTTGGVRMAKRKKKKVKLGEAKSKDTPSAYRASLGESKRKRHERFMRRQEAS